MVNALMVTDALRKAFEAFHLDWRNEDHWHRLTGILAERQFSDGRRYNKGAPKKWTDQRQYQLALDAYEIESQNKGRRHSSRKLARLIYEKFPAHYEQRSETAEPWHEIYVQILAMKEKYENK